MLTLPSPFYNNTDSEVKFAQGHTTGKWLSWDWKHDQSGSKSSCLPCFPLRTHSLKQSAFFIHHRKGGNYVWPTASLTPPLSQLNGKHRQSWQSTPCPSNISTALCFLNLSCHGWGRTFTSNLLMANIRLIWLWKQRQGNGSDYMLGIEITFYNSSSGCRQIGYDSQPDFFSLFMASKCFLLAWHIPKWTLWKPQNCIDFWMTGFCPYGLLSSKE